MLLNYIKSYPNQICVAIAFFGGGAASIFIQFAQGYNESKNGRDSRTEGNTSCYNDMYLARSNRDTKIV